MTTTQLDLFQFDRLDIPGREIIPLETVLEWAGNELIFSEDPTQDLIHSIDQHGIIHPVIFTENEGKKTLQAGRRRIKAAVYLGIEEIPVVIIPNIDDLEGAVLSISDNNTRKENIISDFFSIRRIQKIAEIEGIEITESSCNNW